MARLSSELVISLIDRVTAPARGVAASMSRLQQRARQNAAAMNAMQGRMLGAVGMGYALARSISAPVQSAMAFNAQMGNVATLVDTSKESMSAMKNQVLELGKRTPVAISDLTGALYNIRSAGIPASQAMNVLEQSARLGVAGLGTTAEAADLATSAINAFKVPAAEQPKLFDNIFKAVKNGKTTISDLTQGFGAVAPTVAEANVKTDEFLASVAALTTSGMPAAQAYTQLKAAISGLSRDTKQTSAIFHKLGAKNFKDLVAKSGGMVGAFNRINKALGGDSAKLQELFGSTEAVNAVLGLTGAQGKIFTATLDDMRNGADAVGEAFDKQLAEPEKRLQVVKNQLQTVSIAIGNALLPALVSIGEAVTPFIEAVGAFAAANPQVTAAVVGTAAALVGLTVAATGARFAFLFLRGGFLSAGIGAAKAAGGLLSLSGRLKQMVLGAQMLSAVGGGGLMSGLVSGLTAAAGTVASVAGGIVTAIAGITAPVWGTIALVVAAVAALALAIYHYWEPISNFVSGFASVIGAALGGLLDTIVGFGARVASAVGKFALNRLIDVASWLGIDEATVRAVVDKALATIRNGFTAMIDWVKALPGQVGSFLSDMFSMKDYSDEAEAGFQSAGERAGHALVNAIEGAFDDLWAWLKSIPGRIVDAIGNIDLSSIIHWPRMPSWLGGGDEPAATAANDNGHPALAGTRAAGGAVLRGRTYLVGERGRELFTPSEDGFVHDAASTQAMTVGRGGGGAAPGARPSAPSLSVGDIHIHVTGQADAGAIAREIGQRLRRELAGIQADSEYAVA